MSKRTGRNPDTPAPALLTDAELLETLKRKQSDEHFREVVSRHGKTVMASCRQVLADPADLEDAFQATFVVLFRKLGSVDGATLSAWLYAVAHRVAVRTLTDRHKRIVKENRAAKKQSHSTVASDLSARPFPLAQMPARQTPEREIPHNEIPVNEISWRESVQILHEEIDRLPEACRQVLILCYLCGHSREEAALCLNRSVGAVKGALERGRKMLAGRLARRGIAWSVGLLAVVTGSSAPAMSPAPSLIEMTVQAAKQQPVHGWAGWFPGGWVMARMAVSGFMWLAAALGLTVWLAPGQVSGNNRAEIEEIAALHQKAIDSFKTLHLKVDVLAHKDEAYQEELWKEGENYRSTTTNFLRPGGKKEVLVKDGKESAWTYAQIPEATNPLFHGWIRPSSKDSLITPLGHCLLGCFGQTSTPSSNTPFRQILTDTDSTTELKHVTESGHSFAVVKLTNQDYAREIWLSKDHHYLVSKLIQKKLRNEFSGEHDPNAPKPVPFHSTKNEPIEPIELNPTVIFSVETFTEVAPGVYFPTRMKVQRQGKADPDVVMTANSIEVNRPIDPAAFDFQFPLHLRVWDSVEEKIWMTDENGAIGVEARDDYGNVIPFHHKPSHWTATWIPIFLSLLMIGGLLRIALKRLRKRRQPVLSFA